MSQIATFFVTLEALKKIDGFGDARLSKYGERLCCSAGPRE